MSRIRAELKERWCSGTILKTDSPLQHDTLTGWVKKFLKNLLCGDNCSSTLSGTHTKDILFFYQPPLNSGQNTFLKRGEGEYFECTAGSRRKPT